MKNSSRNWAVAYAFTYNQGYYFSAWYFVLGKQHSSIHVNRGPNGDDCS